MTLIRNADARVSNKITRFIPLPVLRAIYGLLLALGAPFGWIAVQWLFGRDPFASEHIDPLLYGYMTIATGIVFSALGYAIGTREKMITGLALTDGLTGLYNKRYFENRLFQEFSRYRRQGNPISLIQIDLDHFKRVNDTWGHQAGDEVLRVISSLIMHNCRINEVAARVGGEELSVIAIDCDLEDARKLAERLRHEIEELKIDWEGQQITITSSFGVATANDHMTSPLEIYQKADEALYQAKTEGRNRVCLAK